MLTHRSFLIVAMFAMAACKADISTSGVKSLIDSVSAAPATPNASPSPCNTATVHSSSSPTPAASQKTEAPTPFKLLFKLSVDAPEGLVVWKGEPIIVWRGEIKSTHDIFGTEFAYRLDRSSHVLMNVEFDIDGEIIFSIPANDTIQESFYLLHPYTEPLIKANRASVLTVKIRNFQNLPVDVRMHIDVTGIRLAGANMSIDPAVEFVSGNSVNIAVIPQ